MHVALVSIRLADAWPFQRGYTNHQGPYLVRFNPPCGCVAFSTGGAGGRGRAGGGFNPPCGCVAFSTRASGLRPQDHSPCFNPPCGCVAFSTTRRWMTRRSTRAGFNPPCGCVAFSTYGVTADAWDDAVVSIRLADAWPFQLPAGRPSGTRCTGFQSALRMRGLFNAMAVARCHSRRCCFNPPCGCVAFSTRSLVMNDRRSRKFQSALRMRGLFNPTPTPYGAPERAFQSALRMRGLFNRGARGGRSEN